MISAGGSFLESDEVSVLTRCESSRASSGILTSVVRKSWGVEEKKYVDVESGRMAGSGLTMDLQGCLVDLANYRTAGLGGQLLW